MKKLTAEKARELIAAWELNRDSVGLTINAEYCLQAMEYWLDQPKPYIAAPEGWKLVPVEPTPEMVVYGQERMDECIDMGFDSSEDGSVYEYSRISSDAPFLIYNSMLAAAPEYKA